MQGLTDAQVRNGFQALYGTNRPMLFADLQFLAREGLESNVVLVGTGPQMSRPMIHVHQLRDEDSIPTHYIISFRAGDENAVYLLDPEVNETMQEMALKSRATALRGQLELMAELVVLYGSVARDVTFTLFSAPFCPQTRQLPRLEQGVACLAYVGMLCPLLKKNLSGTQLRQQLTQAVFELKTLINWVKFLTTAPRAPVPHFLDRSKPDAASIEVGLTDRAEVEAYQRKPQWEHPLNSTFNDLCNN